MKMGDKNTIFDCFFIVHSGGDTLNNSLIFPPNYEDPQLKQYFMFCFPFDSINSISSTIVQRNQHFTFMLTDLEKRHRYGFCKLTNGGTACYCFLSYQPWFEVFYKLLNCMFELHSKHNLASMDAILKKLYETNKPSPNQSVQISNSLMFNAPPENSRPSIPENRNLMEYYSACSPKIMMEVFAALMYERRVIFTSSSLSILAGCVFAAETLIYPLNWQHIYIPILPPHVLDYCTAPIPYLIGIHTSLMSSVRNKIRGDEFGIVIVNVDDKNVESPFNDLETIPNDVVSYLKSQLNKPNVAVGTHLAQTFLKAQARLIGGYRNALKFHSGKAIVFDNDIYINSQTVKSKRAFAEELIQLQTFKEFVDKRLSLLNDGIGFRDDFEVEINYLQEQEGNTQNTVYKDWVSMKQKGGEFITKMQKKAKENYKVAKQSMKEATKSNENQTTSHGIVKRQSLRESVKSIRPPRPSPPKPRRQAPPRPPLPSAQVRKYKVIDFDEDNENAGEVEASDETDLHSIAENINVIEEEEINTDLLIDFSDMTTSPDGADFSDHSQPKGINNNVDLLGLFDTDMPGDSSPTLLQPTQTYMKTAYQISKEGVLSPNGMVDLFGFSWTDNDNMLTDERKPMKNPVSAGSDWFDFEKITTQPDSTNTVNNGNPESGGNKKDTLLNIDEDCNSGLPPPLLPGL